MPHRIYSTLVTAQWRLRHRHDQIRATGDAGVSTAEYLMVVAGVIAIAAAVVLILTGTFKTGAQSVKLK